MRKSEFDPEETSSDPPPATVVQTSPGSGGPSNALSSAAGGATLGAIVGDPGIEAAISACLVAQGYQVN